MYAVIKRTTIELDEELLARAQRALHAPTIRATVEEALRRAADAAEAALDDRALRQRRYLAQLSSFVEADVLASEAMWR
jgi:Arc/MetJ family transcription regulator